MTGKVCRLTYLINQALPPEDGNGTIYCGGSRCGLFSLSMNRCQLDRLDDLCSAIQRMEELLEKRPLDAGGTPDAEAGRDAKGVKTESITPAGEVLPDAFASGLG